jgi:GNAT superfamily N-acetyltransferase
MAAVSGLQISRVDADSAEACSLIRSLSLELARRYDFMDDGSGHFTPEDTRGPNSAFLIGRLDDEPVACGAIRPLEAGVCEVKRMFVVAEQRGRGFSRALLAELERIARSMGYTRARLETGDRQPEAIGLYEKAGYRRIPNFGIYVDQPRSVCFEKCLTEEQKDSR